MHHRVDHSPAHLGEVPAVQVLNHAAAIALWRSTDWPCQGQPAHRVMPSGPHQGTSRRSLGPVWRRRARPAPAQDSRPLDVQDSAAVQRALALVGQHATSLTIYMCWHGGRGHDYPVDVMQAAGRLRARHSLNSASDDVYTSLTFVPSDDDLADFALLARYCDLAYATDAGGDVLLEVSDEGASGSTRRGRT